ncbi:MAG TPA: hypothetical protein VF230_01625 [Acidimicrobiales bacterium]
MLKNLLRTLTIVAIALTTAPTAASAGTASSNPCEGKGGAIYAQASGVGDEQSIEVACADGTWELY